MQITGSIRVEAATGEALPLARLDEESMRIQSLSDAGIEALCTLLDAMDTGDVARKITRFVAAAASPGAVLGRMYEHEPEALASFCLQLAAFRAYMARITGGDTPARAAAHAEQARRAWLARAVRRHRVEDGPDAEAPAGDTSGLDMDYEPIDVYDAEGELDLGAVRAEVDRLLRRLNVPPARIALQLLPDEHP